MTVKYLFTACDNLTPDSVVRVYTKCEDYVQNNYPAFHGTFRQMGEGYQRRTVSWFNVYPNGDIKILVTIWSDI